MFRSLLFLCVGLLAVNLCSAQSIDVCNSAVALSLPDVVSGNTDTDPVVTVMDFQLESPCSNTDVEALIWSILVTSEEMVIFETSNLSSDDTYLELVQGSCDDLECTAVNDNGGEGTRSRLEVTLEADTQYFVLLHHASSDSGVSSGLTVNRVTSATCNRICAHTSSCTTAARDGCTACAEPRFLNKAEEETAGSCDYFCPDGMFENVNDRTCQPCDDACARCDADGECFECELNSQGSQTYLAEGKCLVDCPLGRFTDTQLNYCVLCEEECSQCNSKEVCTACKSNFFLNGDKCVRFCPDKFFGDGSSSYTGGTCRACESPCDDCTGQSTDCESCIAPFFYLNGECVTGCGMDHYPAGRFCAACHDLCDEGCTGPERTDCEQMQ